MAGYDPLKLPAPPNFGYDSFGNRAPIDANFAYNMGEVRAPDPRDVTTPEQAARTIDNFREPIRMPDAVRASMGAGDRQIVGELLKIVNGQESGLKVGPDIARSLLDQWGYPHDPDAWSYDEWQQAIESRSLEPSPEQLISQQAFGY